jgi:hypothetical protein
MGLLYLFMSYNVGPDSEHRVATRYGLDSPKIKIQWGGGRDFLHPS